MKSGLELGTATTPFQVKDITGPHKGKSLCYRCAYGAKPVTCIFTREITEEVASLVQADRRDGGSQSGQGHARFVVLLTKDADAGAKALAKLAADKGIKNIPLTVFDGSAGPPEYKISKDAAVTVLMWNKGHVEVNHAFDTAKLTSDQVKVVIGRHEQDPELSDGLSIAGSLFLDRS